jgi:acetyltransferase-like isoleucine patch superfamily enzyme
LGHDVSLHDYVTLAPGVHVSGKVAIGHGAYLGTGAVTVDGGYDQPLVIGERAVVGAGAVVTRDVPPATTVVGVPARAR